MTEIRREDRHPPDHLLSVAIPIQQRLHCESVASITIS